jgi:hypothetical protein
MAEFPNKGKSIPTRITTKLKCTDPIDWRYSLQNQGKAYTMPTRAETQVFLGGSQGQHGDAPKATSGDPYDV